MNIRILYDNEATSGFEAGWGFSVLIDGTTLFDTGESVSPLLRNLQRFNVSPGTIQRIVLSHADWDHVGGMEIIRHIPSPEIYQPASFSPKFKEMVLQWNQEAKIYPVNDSREICPGQTVTRQMGAQKKEISLVVRSKKGLVLFVGCSHPGLDHIIQEVSPNGSLYAVIGGFHGFSRPEILADIPVIVPTHCTQWKERIVRMFPDQTQLVQAGTELDL